MSDKKTLYQNLAFSLPEWKRRYAETPLFKQLCDDFINFLECDNREKQEFKMNLQHTISNFDNLCESDPDSEKNQRECEEALIKRKRELHLKHLYEIHLAIKFTV